MYLRLDFICTVDERPDRPGDLANLASSQQAEKMTPDRETVQCEFDSSVVERTDAIVWTFGAMECNIVNSEDGLRLLPMGRDARAD